MGHGLRKRAVPCAVLRAPRTGQAFLGEALRAIDQRQWPKDRPTTLEKTDNARTGAFALNESRPGAMTKPWRRSWEKGPPSRNGGIVLVAVFHVKAMNRWGMLSEHGKRRSVRPNLPQGEKKMGKLARSVDALSCRSCLRCVEK